MAKKVSKKAPRKAPSRVGKKGSKKAGGSPARKKSRPASGPSKSGPGAPRAAIPKTGPVSSGSGATPHEIGRAVVEHINAGSHGDGPLWDRFWSAGFVSIEGIGMQWAGRGEVETKNADWAGKHIVHGASAEGPFVGATGFAIRFRIDVEERGTGVRHVMDEVGVYTVQDGKVVREEFMYGPVTPV